MHVAISFHDFLFSFFLSFYFASELLFFLLLFFFFFFFLSFFLLCFRVKAQSVKYILLFLYGAMVEVPVADITSVIQASDMFGMEGLKEWLCFLLARDLCHFFHKVSVGP